MTTDYQSRQNATDIASNVWSFWVRRILVTIRDKSCNNRTQAMLNIKDVNKLTNYEVFTTVNKENRTR